MKQVTYLGRNRRQHLILKLSVGGFSQNVLERAYANGTIHDGAPHFRGCHRPKGWDGTVLQHADEVGMLCRQHYD